jgi:hypothetical protein
MLLPQVSAWDVLRVAPEVNRSLEAGPEGLDVICIGGRKPKRGDTERFEDFLGLIGALLAAAVAPARRERQP